MVRTTKRFRITKIKRIFPAALVIFFMSGVLPAEENLRTAAGDACQVQCRVTPEEPVLADTLAMTVTLTADTGVSGTFPDFGGRCGDFRVERTKDEPVQTAENRTIFSRTYFLKPIRPGEGILPPIPVEITQKKNTQNNDAQNGDAQNDGAQKDSTQKQVLFIPAGKITVRSGHQPETASLDSFAPARRAASRLPALAGIIAAGLLLAGAASFWAVRAIRKREKAAEQNPPLSPYERADLEIDALEASKLWVSDVKQFYQRLTGIVRRFIEETTGLRAPERTTEEFLREAEHWGRFDSETKRHLARFLEFADLVKFAKFRPEEPDIADGIQKARDFVRKPVSAKTDAQNDVPQMNLPQNRPTPDKTIPDKTAQENFPEQAAEQRLEQVPKEVPEQGEER